MASNLSCNWCSYRCKAQLDLIKHSFGAHSIESTFIFKCGIRGCLHQFRSGTSFVSFKSHADRKHPNWRDNVSNSTALPARHQQITPIDNELERKPFENLSSYDESVSTSLPHIIDSNPLNGTPEKSIPQHTAALFLLTLQERFRNAINYAVGSVNTIIESVCTSAMKDADPDMPQSIQYDDPYQQSKENFGLIVSIQHA